MENTYQVVAAMGPNQLFSPKVHVEDVQFGDSTWLSWQEVKGQSDGYFIKCKKDRDKLAVSQQSLAVLKVL